MSLIYHNRSSKTPSTEYSGQYGQQEYRSPDYIDMLIEEAEKLYNKLAKELGDEFRSDYAYSISSPSLPLLSPSDEKERQSHPRQTTAAIQSYMYTEEHKFVQSEIDMKTKINKE